MNYIDLLKSQFNNQIAFREKRPGITQLILPLYHEDGDMVEIFLENGSQRNGKLRICDHGMALMRLSYTFELNTPKKEEIFQRILSENQVLEDQGNLYMDIEPEELYPAILQFAQAVAKVASMRLYKREVIQSLFYEILEEFVETELGRFHPRKSFFPISTHEEYEVDYCFNSRPRPVYLWGVNSQATARLATISCLKFQADGLRFSGAVVLDSLDSLGKKDQSRLMSAADKIFPSLDDFKENSSRFLERELTS